MRLFKVTNAISYNWRRLARIKHFAFANFILGVAKIIFLLVVIWNPVMKT